MTRMSAGQPVSLSPSGPRRSSPVSSATSASGAATGAGRRPAGRLQRGLGQQADRRAGAPVEVETDRVVHPRKPGAALSALRWAGHDRVRGTGAVKGDQHAAAGAWPGSGRSPRWSTSRWSAAVLLAGVARPQPDRQRLAGVVAPGGQRVVAEAALVLCTR